MQEIVQEFAAQEQFGQLFAAGDGPKNSKYKSFELPGARPHYNPDRPGQVEHIALDLQLDIPNKVCEGTCTIRLKPVRDGIETLAIDAVDMAIAAVTIAQTGKGKGKPVEQQYDYDGNVLTLRLAKPTTAGKAIEIAIAYRLDHPQRGLYFTGPTEHYPDKPIQVWTQGEDEDSRYWFPCFDYPGQLATSEIRIEVPKPLTVVSNGELIEKSEQKKTTTFHWKQEEIHPSYLITLAIGDFAEIADTASNGAGKTIPCPYYVAKGLEADAKRSLGKTPRMIEFLAERFGHAYPFPKYAQVFVQDFIFGGMENTSATLLTDRCLLDERAALDDPRTETLVEHELCHQWFGDLLVIKHWSHAWLKEGMATYSEAFWFGHEYGPDEAAYARLAAQREYLSEDRSRYRRPIVTHVYREAIELYDRHLYDKASCVYHMLRAELGDELFWKAIQQFVNDNAHSTVETIDLIRAIETATGRNLAFLFDQYVFRGGHPDYKVAYSWDGDSNLAKVTVTQTQAEADGDGKDLFDLKLPIAFGYIEAEKASSGKKGQKSSPEAELKTFTVRIHEREQSFYFPLEAKPQFISFDHGNDYLKTVELAYPLAELKAQLSHDPDPLARIFAAQAIAQKGGLEAVKALGQSLADEAFWGVRLEVAQALGGIQLDQALDGLLLALKEKHPKVRRAVVSAISRFKTLKAYKALKAIAEKGDPTYTVEAAAIRALGNLAMADLDGGNKEKPVLKLMKSILKERSGWNEMVRGGAIAALAQMKTSEAALELILEYTTPGTADRLRLAAVRGLGLISSGQSPANLERILNRLADVARETEFMTQVSLTSALGAMETPKAIGLLQTLASQSPDGRIKQRAEETIVKVQKKIGSSQAIEQLRQELDQLKQSNQNLKSRLENLEAKK